MASINGFRLKKLKKKHTKTGEIYFCGELWLGSTKVADWEQTNTTCDSVIPSEGFRAGGIIAAVKRGGSKSFEENMDKLKDLVIYEHDYITGLKMGYKGLAIAEDKRYYIGRWMDESDLGKTEEEYRGFLADEISELSEMYPGEIPRIYVFTGRSDFMLGKPATFGDIRENHGAGMAYGTA